MIEEQRYNERVRQISQRFGRVCSNLYLYGGWMFD